MVHMLLPSEVRADSHGMDHALLHHHRARDLLGRSAEVGVRAPPLSQELFVSSHVCETPRTTQSSPPGSSAWTAAILRKVCNIIAKPKICT